jgi:hypothetical protein
VALALRVGKIVALVTVQGKAQLALICPKMVLHKVRVFGDIDGLEGELPQPLTTINGLIL